MGRLPQFRATGAVSAVARAMREWPGWFAAAAGAVLCVLGWYGVSGENVVEQQVPYLASATVPGAALIIAGAVLAVGRSSGRSEGADRRIEQLYALLVDDGTADGGPAAVSFAPVDEPSGAATALAVPEGTVYHRRGCPLVADKSSAEPVGFAEIRERSLAPCPVCEPAPPAPPTPPATPDADSAD
jgi:hypothetical protein